MAKKGILDRLKEFDSPTVSNAVEGLHIRSKMEGYANSEIKCLFPNLGVMVGYALTASVDTMKEDTHDLRERLLKMYKSIQSARKPVVMVVKDVSRKRKAAALWGGVMSTICHRLGCIGLVTDGAVRDLPDAENLGFHYFPAGIVVSHGMSSWLESMGEPVEVCGLKVRSGDLIHGDRNGIVVIPSEKAEGVIRESVRVREKEAEYMKAASSPKFNLEKFRELYLKK